MSDKYGLYVDKEFESSNPQVVKCQGSDGRSLLFLTHDHEVQIGETPGTDALVLRVLGRAQIQTLPEAPGGTPLYSVVVDGDGNLYRSKG